MQKYKSTKLTNTKSKSPSYCLQPTSNMSQIQNKENKNTKLEIRVFIFYSRPAKCRKCKNTKARNSQIQNTKKYKIKVPI